MSHGQDGATYVCGHDAYETVVWQVKKGRLDDSFDHEGMETADDRSEMTRLRRWARNGGNISEGW